MRKFIITVEEIDDESENQVDEYSEMDGSELREVSIYARFFDETSAYWTKDAEYNLTFLKQMQHYASEVLRLKGHIFLNEVYDMLGLPRTKAGQVVGWIYDEKNPVGDNCVDFDIYAECNRNFVNGYKNTALLDFNVDGCIADKIPETKETLSN